MDHVLDEASWLDWLLPWYAAASALAMFLPIELYSSQWGALLYAIFAVPFFSVAIVVNAVIAFVRRKPRRGLAMMCTLLAFVATSWALLRNQQLLRTEVRWLFASETYKSEMLVSPIPRNGEVRHIEWDGWGFPGAGDTTVYLVFDPSDSLSVAAKRYSPGRYQGLPCEVPDVHRLEKNWYTVLFYTDTDWEHCS